MRSRVFSLLLAAVALALIPIVAEAGHRHAPRGWGKAQVVHHHRYQPRYRHVYHEPYRYDRHAYRAAPRGYYPYYNSGYWAPTRALRYRRDCCRPVAALPPYYRAWGHPHRYYAHRKWHRRHHGHHRHHHW